MVVSACAARRWIASGQRHLAVEAVHTSVAVGSLAAEVDTGPATAVAAGRAHGCHAAVMADRMHHTAVVVEDRFRARPYVPGRTLAPGC